LLGPVKGEQRLFHPTKLHRGGSADERGEERELLQESRAENVIIISLLTPNEGGARITVLVGDVKQPHPRDRVSLARVRPSRLIPPKPYLGCVPVGVDFGDIPRGGPQATTRRGWQLARREVSFEEEPLVCLCISRNGRSPRLLYHGKEELFFQSCKSSPQRPAQSSIREHRYHHCGGQFSMVLRYSPGSLIHRP
jgi:hypothetical protein